MISPPARPWYRFGGIAVVLLLLVFTLTLLAGPATARAQGRLPQTAAPESVVAAARADLGARLGADPASLELLRAEAVIWTDGCIGAAGPDEFCTQALVDGFVLWLGDGEDAYRYHSDTTATALRLAQSMIPLSQVPVAPLPQGAVPASALARLLDRFRDAGFDEIIALELAAMRDWIPGAFSPHYIVGGATLEIFELSDRAQVDAAINRLSDFGGEAELGDNQTLWRYDELIVILLNASERSDVQLAINDLIGPPLVTSPADPAPRPSRAALDTSVGAVIDALKRAGIEAVLSDFAVGRAVFPPSTLSAVLLAGDAGIEVFALVDRDAVATALRAVAGDAELSRRLMIWTRGSTMVLLSGDHPSVTVAISAVLGAPAFVGAAVTAPTAPPPPADGPVALPATGNGGIEGDGDPPAWVWGVIAAVAGAAIAAGGAYRLWLRSRSR